MATRQTGIRLPTGILEAIDARRDADNDRTAIIISLLTSALTGEYIKPKENTTQIVEKLTKSVKSLEGTVEELSFQIKKQTRIDREYVLDILASQAQIVSERNIQEDDDTDIDRDEDSAISLATPNDADEDEEDDEGNGDSEYVEDIEPPLAASSEPTKFTHQEFIARFGCCQPNGCWEVRFKDGGVWRLDAVSRDAIRATAPNGMSKLRMVGEVDSYQLSA